MSLAVTAKIFLRSFFVQSSWSFEKMQNLGFYFLIYPALAAKYDPPSEAFRRAQLRHLGFFNTHPYFAALVAGTVAREEGGEADRGNFLADLKRSLMCSLGSVGDEFFWATLHPLAALAAVVPALFDLWWAPLVLLGFFNLPHLYFRWWGAAAGLRWGRAVVSPLQALGLTGKVPGLSMAATGLAGVAAGVVTLHPRWALLPGEGTGSLLAALAALGFFIILLTRASLERVLFGLAALVLLGGIVREVLRG